MPRAAPRSRRGALLIRVCAAGYIIMGRGSAERREAAAPRPGCDQPRFTGPFTAAARLAFAEPGCSGCCWL
jgi:hypothetical protein